MGIYLEHSISRRNLLRLTGVAGVAGLTGMTGLSLAACTTTADVGRPDRPVRQNIASLSANDRVVKSYAKAVHSMQQRSAANAADPLGWTYQANIHATHCPHGSWLFLPWHRAYLYYFEDICRKESGDESFMLPYWNWTTNPAVPDVMVTNPRLQHDRVNTADPLTDPGWIGPGYTETIQQLPFPDYAGRSATWGGAIEGPHGYVHGRVGGSTFDMGRISNAALDPLFWLHHNRVEQLWVEANLRRRHPNTNAPAWLGSPLPGMVDRTGAAVNVTVADVLDLPLLSYRYDLWM